MGFNFFQWIREGVKHSVISGVSDAVEHLGTPRDGDDVQQRLTAFLQDNRAAPNPPRIGSDPSRKKLGRTLQQIQSGAAPAT